MQASLEFPGFLDQLECPRVAASRSGVKQAPPGAFVPSPFSSRADCGVMGGDGFTTGVTT